MPWSAATTTMTLGSTRGLPSWRIPATAQASSSRRPRLPRGFVLESNARWAVSAWPALGGPIAATVRSSRAPGLASSVTGGALQEPGEWGQLDRATGHHERGPLCRRGEGGVDAAERVPVGPRRLVGGDDPEAHLVAHPDRRAPALGGGPRPCGRGGGDVARGPPRPQ